MAIFLALWHLPRNISKVEEDEEHSDIWAKIARIDFAGCAIIPMALTSAFVCMDLAAKFYTWVYLVPLAISSVVLCCLFYYVEKYHAKEPIIPISLISQRDVLVPYFLTIFQTAAQFIVSGV